MAASATLSRTSFSSCDDAIARLAQAVIELAEILLQRFGLLGGPIEVLVDLVDVVALDPEAELDGAQRVEDG